MNAALYLARRQHVSAKSGADGGCLQPGAERRTGNAAIKTCHHAHLRIGKRSDDFAQIIARDPYVAVVDKQEFVFCIGQHLDQIAHLQIGSQNLRADDEPDAAIPQLCYQPVYYRDCGIVWVAHAEDDFELGIVLKAVAAQILVSLRISAAQRLENRDGRRKCHVGLVALCQKAASAPETEQVVTYAAQRSENRDKLKQRMRPN